MNEPSRRIPYRTWPGALAVMLAIAAYVGGLTLWDRHTPGNRPLPPGDPGFQACYEDVGDFPEVDLPSKTIYTRIVTAFGFPMLIGPVTSGAVSIKEMRPPIRSST